MGLRRRSLGLTERWWEDNDVVTTRLAGAFEGGGAKGAAYVGALEATLEQGCWFGAVAGASAGAITAALIAAGLSPARIRAESVAAFDRLGSLSAGAGLRRLRLRFGYLDNEGVHSWLEGLLAEQVRAFGVEVEGPVTFSSLYMATTIELNVVGADLTRGQQVVFSVWDTPAVQVADAVLASSSIPFAFPPRYLRVGHTDGTFVHTIVDGGVWSNFPTFVFADRSFRLASGRDEAVAEDYVVGYLLDDSVDTAVDYAESAFVGIDYEADPREWHPAAPASQPSEGSARRGLRFLAAVVSSPVWALLRLGAWLSLGRHRAWKARWPSLRGLAGAVLRLVDDALSALHSAWLASVAVLGLVIGAVVSIDWLVRSFLVLRLDELWLSIVFDDPASIVSETLQVVLVAVSIALIVTIVVFVVAGVAANYLVLGPARQVMFGVVRTYAAGPGAPAWAGRSATDHVVRLPIPKALTTLSFDRTDPAVAAAIAKAEEDAHRATTLELIRVLSQPANAAVSRPPPPDPVAAPATGTLVPSGGGGPALALRLTVVAVVLGVTIFVAGQFVGEPSWRRFQTNVRVCAEPMHDPGADCAEPTPTAVVASVLFGPGAAGHRTQATLSVEGRIVDRSAVMANPPEGRILHVPIDRSTLCGRADCRVTVDARVDGEVVYRRIINQRTVIETELRRG